eukprot:gene17061-26174_t
MAGYMLWSRYVQRKVIEALLQAEIDERDRKTDEEPPLESEHTIESEPEEDVPNTFHPHEPGVPDYYGKLGVSSMATKEEVTRAYRQLIVQYHPDKHPNASPEKAQEIDALSKDINQAYTTLKDDRKREVYNAWLGDQKRRDLLASSPVAAVSSAAVFGGLRLTFACL